MTFCKVEKANIYYEDVGKGTPIIMIHGFTPDHRLMKGCMEPIFENRPGWRRIYIDLPGMGQTKDYESINNSDEMLEAVLEFIDTILPDQSFLISGQSYGGYITRGVLKQRRERVLGAAFLCPMVIPDNDQRSLPVHQVIHSDPAFLSTLTEEEREDFQTIHVVLNEYVWNRYRTEVLAGIQIADEQFLSKIQQGYGFSYILDDFKFEKPSVFLLGKQDQITGYEDAFQLLENYPRATFSVLDRAGHNLHLEQPALFNAHINEWLDRVGEINDNKG